MGWDEGRPAWFLHRLSGVGPMERMGHRHIVIGDEFSDLTLQILHRGEVAAAQNLSLKNAQEDFYLVEPRTVLGEVHEADAMTGVREEPASRGL